MSAVYLARDPVLSRLVAIKVLHQDLALHRPVLDRFFKEAKIAARIRSPHVVEVYDFGQEGRYPFLVMEFIDGRSVQKVLDQLDGRPLDPLIAASLVCQAAEGLAMAAETGVVHRDLKPENLMLSDRGYLKITDFGISHLAEHTVTWTGQVLGSPRFMSPEQVKGIKPITFHSDMFSLGTVLFYFISGRTPFQAETVPELHKQITGKPHPSLVSLRPDADPILSLLVDTLLQKNPAKRGEGPRWLLTQLRTYLHSKRVIDPVEQVARYTRELSAQGIQTTCNLDRSAIRRFMGSFELEKTPARVRRGWKWTAAGLIAAGIVAGGAAILLLLKNKSERLAVPVPLSRPNNGSVAGNGNLEHLEIKLPDRAVIAPAPQPIPPRETGTYQPNIGQANATGESQVPAEKGDAVLSLYSVPANAQVSIDGYDYGRTPLKARFLPAGSYRIILRTEQGVEVDTLLSIPPGPQVHRFALSGLEAPAR
jgi:hypothetical protein